MLAISTDALKVEGEEKIGRVSVHVDHDSTEEDEFAIGAHPLAVDDIEKHLLDHNVGLVCEEGHFLVVGVATVHGVHVGLERIDDVLELAVVLGGFLKTAPFLAVVVRIMLVDIFLLLGQVVVSADRSTTSGGSFGHAVTVHLADNSLVSDAYMRGIQNNDVAVNGDVVAEGTPAGHAGEGDTSEAAKREDLTPTVLHEVGDIFFVVVVVELIRARALGEDGVLLGDALLRDFLVDQLLNDASGKSAGEVVQS